VVIFACFALCFVIDLQIQLQHNYCNALKSTANIVDLYLNSIWAW